MSVDGRFVGRPTWVQGEEINDTECSRPWGTRRGSEANLLMKVPCCVCDFGTVLQLPQPLTLVTWPI